MSDSPITESDIAKNINPRPLDGLRVIELGQILAGPFTSAILGYFGAEIIKIESPALGDPIRNWRIVKDGTSLWWWSLGRNKQSVTINLKTEAGQKIVQDLCRDCDVLVENFRPGVMESWNLGPADIKTINPNLIYSRISGYGQKDSLIPRQAFDATVQAETGYMHISGNDKKPTMIGTV